MEKTWHSTTAGILTIIAGALGLLMGIGLGVGACIGAALLDLSPRFHGGGFLVLVAVAGIAFSIVAIVGGVYALRKRLWGLALAGAICSLLFTLPLLGWVLAILAIIFVSLGKGEFQ